MLNSKIIGLLFCLTTLLSAMHIEEYHLAAIQSQRCCKIRLKSDNGKYLARCNECALGAYPDAAFVHETDGDASWAQWDLEIIGNKVALKGDNGKYLSRCDYCWIGEGEYPNSAFVHITSLSGNPYAMWSLVSIGNGKWALQADTGKYLARCHDCVIGEAYPDSAFVYALDMWVPQAQWTIEHV